MATGKDVAQLAGTPIAVVSYAFTDESRPAATATDKRVLGAADPLTIDESAACGTHTATLPESDRPEVRHDRLQPPR